MTETVAVLEKSGSNPDQAPTAFIAGPGEAVLAVGDEFHIQGQPEDVRWRVVRIEHR